MEESACDWRARRIAEGLRRKKPSAAPRIARLVGSGVRIGPPLRGMASPVGAVSVTAEKGNSTLARGSAANDKSFAKEISMRPGAGTPLQNNARTLAGENVGVLSPKQLWTSAPDGSKKTKSAPYSITVKGSKVKNQ